MSLAENEVFTFTWRIENFSMCPQKCGECLDSPLFAVEMLEKTEWRLKLYPRGRKYENFISSVPECASSGTSSKETAIDFEFIVSSADVQKLIKAKANSTLESLADFRFEISRNKIFCEHKEVYLPKDTFTVIFNISKTDNGPKNSETEDLCGYDSILKTAVSREILRTAARDNLLDFRSQFVSNKVYARTQIKIIKRIFCWPIRRFSTLRTNQRLSIPLKSPLVDLPSFHLTFYLSDSFDGDQSAQIEIRRQKFGLSHGTFVKCNISVRNILKNDQYSIEETHLFEPEETDDTWKLPSLVQSSKLIEDKYFDISQDVLLLRFKFAFAFYQYAEGEYESEDVDIIAQSDESASFSSIRNPFENEFKNFYRDGEFSDARLQVGDRVFKVHKIILSARSTVFSAMFKHDMKEKETGLVEITDLSANTVDRMLTYMYTDALDDLSPEDAVDLYSAANKYEVLPMKLRCISILKSTLSLSNVCDMLILADLHHDDDLRGAAQHLIRTNSQRSFQSRGWKCLMQSNLALAADVMLQLLLKSDD